MTIEARVQQLLRTLPSAAGKRAVVTGANSGLGRETVRQLAALGAAVVLACRDVDKGRLARDDILADVPQAEVRVEPLDLAALASVRRFAERVVAGGGLDLLIAHAGIMALPRRLTQDGFEAQFGVNHLGHFALAGLLLPALRERPGARVVTTTSTAAWSGRIAFDDLMGERRYDRWRAYGQSKLANLLFVRGLARRFQAAGIDASAHAAHPGLVHTDLQRNVSRLAAGEPSAAAAASNAAPRAPGEPPTAADPPSLAGGAPAAADSQSAAARATPAAVSGPERLFLDLLVPLFGQSVQMGALPQVFAALSPEAEAGDLWGPRWFHTRGRPIRVRGPMSGFDEALQDRLWDASEALTGVRFP